MENVLGIVNWIKGNLGDIATAIAYIIAGATIIVKLTPTLADDNILLPIVKFIGKYIALDKFGAGKETRPN